MSGFQISIFGQNPISEDVSDPVECLKLITEPTERYRYAQTMSDYLLASREAGQEKIFELYHYLDTNRF